MRLTISAGAATLAALVSLPLVSPAGAQERATRPRARVELDARRRAEPRAAEMQRELLATRAQALAHAFTLGSFAPDRAVLGVSIGEGSVRGLEVENVTEGSPAERAGIRAGDHLTAVGDVPLRLSETDAADPVMRAAVPRRLTRALDRLDAGDAVTLRVAGEGGAERTVSVTTVRADSLQPARSVPALSGWRMDGDRATLGLRVSPTGTARDTLGAFVASVAVGGPAERAGVYEGQRIAAINGVDLRVAPADVEDRAVAATKAARLERELRDLEAGAAVTLRVWDGRAYRDVKVPSAKASEVYQGGALLQGRLLPAAPGVRRMVEVLPGDARVRVAPTAPSRVLPSRVLPGVRRMY